jgi:hypothetical protein
MTRPLVLIATIPAALCAGIGVLAYQTTANNRSVCASFTGQLAQAGNPQATTECHNAVVSGQIGSVMMVLGFLGILITLPFLFGGGHKASRPPKGWMYVPYGWQPANQPFMPVPPGWPVPRRGWTPPAGWQPHPSWPPPPPGWPQPPR